MKWLKSLGLPLLGAMAAFLEVLAGLLLYCIGFAEDASASSSFLWALKAAAGLSLLGGAVVAALAVAAAIPPHVRLRERLRLVAGTLIALALSLFAGLYVGSLASPLDDQSHPPHSRAYAKSLSRILAGLEDERDRAYRHLPNARGAVAQAAIATKLAEAFARRAAAIRRIRVRTDDLATRRHIATRVESISAAYAELAKAATDPHGSQGELERARERVDRAGRRLRATEETLDGYVVEVGLAARRSLHLHAGSQSG